MLYSEKKNCEAEGCSMKQMRGKKYCNRHVAAYGKPKMTTATQALLRSNCCNASCTVGKKHEYGEQYCDKCTLMCIWKVASV